MRIYRPTSFKVVLLEFGNKEFNHVSSNVKYDWVIMLKG